MNKLMQTVTENVAYVVIFLAVIVGCFLVAVVLEKSAQKKNGVSEPIFNTRKLAMIGMFSAIAMTPATGPKAKEPTKIGSSLKSIL